jgi:hypothetical protein
MRLTLLLIGTLVAVYAAHAVYLAISQPGGGAPVTADALFLSVVAVICFAAFFKHPKEPR